MLVFASTSIISSTSVAPSPDCCYSMLPSFRSDFELPTTVDSEALLVVFCIASIGSNRSILLWQVAHLSKPLPVAAAEGGEMSDWDLDTDRLQYHWWRQPKKCLSLASTRRPAVKRIMARCHSHHSQLSSATLLHGPHHPQSPLTTYMFQSLHWTDNGHPLSRCPCKRACPTAINYRHY